MFLNKNYFLLSLITLFIFFSHSKVKTQENLYTNQGTIYYYKEANSALERRNFRQAIDLYRKVLERNQRHLAAYMGLAECYSQLGLPHLAEKSYQDILKHFPKNIEAQTKLAKVYIEKNFLKEAYKLLMKVHKENPASVENNYTLGLWHFTKGNYTQAKRYFERALQLNTNHIPSLIAMSSLAIQEENPKRAEAYINQAYALKSFNAEIYQAKAHLYLYLAFYKANKKKQLNYVVKAYSALLNAHQLSPQNRSIKEELLYIDIYRENYGDALKILSKLEKQFIDEAIFPYLIGIIYTIPERKNIVKAIQSLKLAIKRNPNNQLIRNTLENVIMDPSNATKVRGLLDTLLAELAKYQNKKANEELKNYRHDLAYTRILRSLSLYPTSQESLKMKTEFLREKKDYEGLLLTYKKLLRIDPKNEKLRYNLEVLIGNRQESLAYQKKLFNPIASTELATFQRSSKKVFIFDLEEKRALARYPDLSRQLARTLSWLLRQPSHLSSPKLKDREEFLKSLKDNDNKLKNYWSAYYKPEYITDIHRKFRDQDKIDYIISGEYTSSMDGQLYAKIELRESNTGTSIQKFSVRTEAENAMMDFINKASQKIHKAIPKEGKIIKVESNNFYINLGAYDNLESKAKFRLYDLDINFPIAQTNAYISRISIGDQYKNLNLKSGMLGYILKKNK